MENFSKNQEKFLEKSKKISNLSNLTTKLSTKTSSLISIIDSLPKLDDHKEEITKTKNLTEIKTFYTKFLELKEKKSNFKKQMKNLDAKNFYLLELRIKLFEELSGIYEEMRFNYPEIIIVKKNVDECERIKEKFVKLLEKSFFEQIEKTELDFVENKKVISLFLQKMLAKNEFIDEYVKKLKINVFQQFNLKKNSNTENQQENLEEQRKFLEAEEIEKIKRFTDFYENIQETKQKLKINTQTLLNKNIAEPVLIQLESVIIEDVNKLSYKNISMLEKLNFVKSTVFVLKQLNFIDEFEVKNFRIVETKNVLNNLIVELRKASIDYKLKILTQKDFFFSNFCEILSLLKERKYFKYLKESVNTLKLREFKDLKAIFVQNIERIVSGIKGKNLNSIIFLINNFSLLKEFYSKIGEINLKSKLEELKNLFIEKFNKKTENGDFLENLEEEIKIRIEPQNIKNEITEKLNVGENFDFNKIFF